MDLFTFGWNTRKKFFVLLKPQDRIWFSSTCENEDKTPVPLVQMMCFLFFKDQIFRNIVHHESKQLISMLSSLFTKLKFMQSILPFGSLNDLPCTCLNQFKQFFFHLCLKWCHSNVLSYAVFSYFVNFCLTKYPLLPHFSHVVSLKPNPLPS